MFVFDRRGSVWWWQMGEGAVHQSHQRITPLGRYPLTGYKRTNWFQKILKWGLDWMLDRRAPSSQRATKNMLVVFMMNCSLASPATPLIDILQDEFYNLWVCSPQDPRSEHLSHHLHKNIWTCKIFYVNTPMGLIISGSVWLFDCWANGNTQPSHNLRPVWWGGAQECAGHYKE